MDKVLNSMAIKSQIIELEPDKMTEREVIQKQFLNELLSEAINKLNE